MVDGLLGRVLSITISCGVIYCILMHVQAPELDRGGIAASKRNWRRGRYEPPTVSGVDGFIGRVLSITISCGVIYCILMHVQARELEHERRLVEERRRRQAELDNMRAAHAQTLETQARDHERKLAAACQARDAAMEKVRRYSQVFPSQTGGGAGAITMVTPLKRQPSLPSALTPLTCSTPASSHRSHTQGAPTLHQGASPSRGDVYLRLNQMLLLGRESNWDEAAAREFVRESQAALTVAQTWLDNELRAGVPTSRAGYLSSLRELIGPQPPHSWKNEWDAMTKEWLMARCCNNWDAAQKLETETLAAVESMPKFQHEVKVLVEEERWTEAHAEAWVFLGLRRDVIARALRERCADYAASTYAVCEALSQALELARPKPASRHVARHLLPTITEPTDGHGGGGGGVGELPPPIYRHLEGKHSLSESDPQWAHIEAADSNGFFGLTSNALTRASTGAIHFTDQVPDSAARSNPMRSNL